MEDEANAAAARQAKELEGMEAEMKANRERIEAIRMEECMTPAQLKALQDDPTEDSGPAASGEAAAMASSSQKKASHRSLNRTRPPLASASTRSAHLQSVEALKVIAPTTPKYRAAVEQIEALRAECAEAEARQAAARQRLSELRQQKQRVKRSAHGTTMSIALRNAALDQRMTQSREQLRGLELHVDRELVRFSAMVNEAKSLRRELDLLLIAQNQFEKNYRTREDALMEVKKEMAFLIEVATLLYEEREQEEQALAESKRIADTETDEYRKVFAELKGVLEANEATKAQNNIQLDQLHTALEAAQKERVELENANERTKAALEKRQIRSRRASSLADGGGGEDGEEGNPLTRSGDRSAMTGDDSAAEGVQVQIREFEYYYNRLADVAESDVVDDVVQYLDRSAEVRFRCFAELQHLDGEMNRLRDRLQQLHAETELMTRETPARRAQLLRMTHTQDHLTNTTNTISDAEAELSKKEGMLKEVIQHIAQLFRALGCDKAALRAETGSETVLRHSAEAALAQIEQRTEEYLVGYAREQVLQATTTNGSGAAGEDDDYTGAAGGDPNTNLNALLAGDYLTSSLRKASQLNVASTAAQTVLHRANLPPKSDGKRGAAEALVEAHGLPNSAETYSHAVSPPPLPLAPHNAVAAFSPTSGDAAITHDPQRPSPARASSLAPAAAAGPNTSGGGGSGGPVWSTIEETFTGEERPLTLEEAKQMAQERTMQSRPRANSPFTGAVGTTRR